jgi:hypothetical protein
MSTRDRSTRAMCRRTGSPAGRAGTAAGQEHRAGRGRIPLFIRAGKRHIRSAAVGTVLKAK